MAPKILILIQIMAFVNNVFGWQPQCEEGFELIKDHCYSKSDQCRKEPKIGEFGQKTAAVNNSLINEAKCPEAWEAFNEFCYLIQIEKTSIQQDAERKCQAQGANLVSIHSDEENNFVKTMLANWWNKGGKIGQWKGTKGAKYFWIGLNLIHETDTKIREASWTDASPMQYANPAEHNFKGGSGPWSDAKWSGGTVPEPNKKSEQCVVMPQGQNVNGQWCDFECDVPSVEPGFICKKPAEK